MNKTNKIFCFDKNVVKKILWSAFCLTVVLSLSCKQREQQSSEKQPNILFIMADDQASGAISAYGNSLVSTPNIDRIAKRGTRFANVFVVSSLCAPSRAAILSGKYPAKTGFKRIGDVFDGSRKNLQKLLQKSGYKTGIIGKWHLRSTPTGFNYWKVFKGNGRFFNPRLYSTVKEWKKGSEKGGIVYPGYSANIYTRLAIEWMRKQESDSKHPFALFLEFHAPHSPHVSPAKYDRYFSQKPLPEPETFNELPGSGGPFLNSKKEGGPEISTKTHKHFSFIINDSATYSKLKYVHPFDVFNSRDNKEVRKVPDCLKRGTQAFKKWAYQTMLKGYYRQVKSLDDNVGRVSNFLKETGLDKNTIIVYTSDNGWFLGDHGLYNKMWMYEESLRIPLIISYPGHIPKDRIDSSIVSELDYAPTLLDYAGGKIPSAMQGRSLKFILNNNKPNDWPKAFFYHYFDQWDTPSQYGIRTRDYALIKIFDPTHVDYELYNLKADPHELHNLFNNPNYKQIRDSLMQKFQQLKLKFER